MAHHKGCLSSLAPVQTQVLVLRTGLGLKHSYTRRQVARILHVSVKQEGQIEQQAINGIASASVHGRCINPLTAVRTAVLRTLRVLFAAFSQFPGVTGGGTAVGGTVLVASPGTSATGGQPAPASRGSTSHGSNGSPSSSGRASAPSSAAIASPPQDRLSWPLLALAIAAGLMALWFIVSWHRTQPEGEIAARPLRSRAGAGALAGSRRLRRGAEALAGVIGLAALRQAASTRRRGEPTATLHRRRDHPPAPPTTPAPETHNGRAEDVQGAEADNGRANDVPDAAVAGAALAGGIEAFELGGALVEKGDMAGAEAAFRRADGQGHPSAASNLGVLLEQRGDFVGAEAAYRRADERGDPTGAFNLGSMLAGRGDLLGAEEALRRADQRGDADSAFHLGTLLESRRDFFNAEAAYRRADERGHPSGAARLGVLLENRGDATGAETAYRRADDRGDAVGAFRLGGILEKRKDLAGAEAAYARAAERGESSVADRANAALDFLRSGR